MSTSLNLYGTNSPSTTLSTACTMVTGTGGVVTSRTTLIGTKSGFGQLWSQTGGTWPTIRQSTIGAPDGHGWLYDTQDLESTSLVSGIWTAKLQLAASVNTLLVGDLYVRWYVYNTISGTYTLITQAVQIGITFSSVQTIYTLTSGSIAAVTLGNGDMVYRDVWTNITIPSTSIGQGLVVRMASSSTVGVANAMETDTPGMERFRTIPCDAALFTGRIIPVTAALQPPTGTRLLPCDSALRLTQTRTIVCDSALTGPSVRTIACTCALMLTQLPRTPVIPRIYGGTLLLTFPQTHVILATAALQIPLARTLPASCSLGSSARLIPATVALKLTQTRSIACSVSLAPSPFTRFPQTSRRTGVFDFTGRRTGVFPEIARRET